MNKLQWCLLHFSDISLALLYLWVLTFVNFLKVNNVYILGLLVLAVSKALGKIWWSSCLTTENLKFVKNQGRWCSHVTALQLQRLLKRRSTQQKCSDRWLLLGKKWVLLLWLWLWRVQSWFCVRVHVSALCLYGWSFSYPSNFPKGISFRVFFCKPHLCLHSLITIILACMHDIDSNSGLKRCFGLRSTMHAESGWKMHALVKYHFTFMFIWFS